MVTAAIFSF